MTERSAFSLVELLVGITMMIVLATAATISLGAAEQNVKREAERVMAYLYRMEDKANRIRQNFDIDTFRDYIYIKWNRDNIDRSFRAASGFSYSDNFSGRLGESTYNARKKQFNTGGTITVKDSRGNSWYVIIASTEGRIRISDTPPK